MRQCPGTTQGATMGAIPREIKICCPGVSGLGERTGGGAQKCLEKEILSGEKVC